MQGIHSLLVANDSNTSDVRQKSIAVTITFFGTASAQQSAREGALLSPDTLPGSSIENKLYNREA